MILITMSRKSIWLALLGRPDGHGEGADLMDIDPERARQSFDFESLSNDLLVQRLTLALQHMEILGQLFVVRFRFRTVVGIQPSGEYAGSGGLCVSGCMRSLRSLRSLPSSFCRRRSTRRASKFSVHGGLERSTEPRHHEKLGAKSTKGSNSAVVSRNTFKHHSFTTMNHPYGKATMMGNNNARQHERRENEGVTVDKIFKKKGMIRNDEE